jgi:sporulation protein YlmC with PRC-barrel domain
MTLIGEVFIADVLGKAVLDPLGEEIGTLRDIAVEVGSPFPRAAGLVLEKKRKTWFLPWSDLSIFNRRIISSRKRESELSEFQPSQEQLLIGKDILDKQIVDINGAKVVRVNDVKLTEEGGAAYVTDVDAWGWSGAATPFSTRSAILFAISSSPGSSSSPSRPNSTG